MAVRRSVQIQAPAREVEVVQAKKIRRIMRMSLAKRAKEGTSRSQGQKTLRKRAMKLNRDRSTRLVSALAHLE